MRSKPGHPLLIILTLLALGWAQVFGMSRGYVCDCGGQVEITVFDHCHGPHGMSCHHDDAPIHHDHDEDEDSDTHKHSPLKESVQAKQLAAQTSSVPMPVLAVLSILEPLTMLVAVNEETARPQPPPWYKDPGRRWPAVLTRTIALRI